MVTSTATPQDQENMTIPNECHQKNTQNLAYTPPRFAKTSQPRTNARGVVDAYLKNTARKVA